MLKMTTIFSNMNSSSSTSVQNTRCPIYSSSSSNSHGHNHHSRTSERIVRRKWVLEKWLIWITLLVTSILLDSAYGEIMCYECAWQGSSALPSTADGVSDICRPHNFNVDVVHKVKCPNGCKKQALYEFENDPSGTSRVAGGGPNANNTNGSRATLENMTFYVRGCVDDKKTRESCENKSFHNQVYALECVCLSDYCNGERSSGLSPAFFQFFSGSRESRKISKNLAFLSKDALELSIVASLINYSVTNLFASISKGAQ